MKLIYEDMVKSCEKYDIKLTPAIKRLLKRMESCKRINSPEPMPFGTCNCFLCLQITVQTLFIKK